MYTKKLIALFHENYFASLVSNLKITYFFKVLTASLLLLEQYNSEIPVQDNSEIHSLKTKRK